MLNIFTVNFIIYYCSTIKINLASIKYMFLASYFRQNFNLIKLNRLISELRININKKIMVLEIFL